MAEQFALLELAAPEVRRVVKSRLKTLSARRGRALLTAGARPDQVFLIFSGKARVVLFSLSGREVLLRDLGPGDLFGELAALDGKSRSASVVALTDVKVAMMSAADFLALVRSSAEAAMWLAGRLGAEVRRLTEKVFELSALNVQTRLHCELLRLARTATAAPGDVLRISPAPRHAELAARIGAQRKSVSREMRALANRGILRSGRAVLELRALDQLARWPSLGAPDSLEAAA